MTLELEVFKYERFKDTAKDTILSAANTLT
jgi:hypothetical protein